MDYYRVWEDNGSVFEECIAENLTEEQARKLVRAAPAHIKRRMEKQDGFMMGEAFGGFLL